MLLALSWAIEPGVSIFITDLIQSLLNCVGFRVDCRITSRPDAALSPKANLRALFMGKFTYNRSIRGIEKNNSRQYQQVCLALA